MQKGELKMNKPRKTGLMCAVVFILVMILSFEIKEHREDYEIELWEAKNHAACGNLIRMENHLGFAQYETEKDGVDISIAVEEIRLEGRKVAARKAFESAEKESCKGNDEEMNYYLRKHRYLCSVLGKKPDEEAIERLKEICQKHNKFFDDSG